MKTIYLRFFIAVLLLLSLQRDMSFGQKPMQETENYQEIGKILGMTGQIQEGAYVVRFGRSDLKVTIDGEEVSTAIGFGAWTAWKKMGTKMMVMGDLVLLQK
jgi:hypothetical protein